MLSRDKTEMLIAGPVKNTRLFKDVWLLDGYVISQSKTVKTPVC